MWQLSILDKVNNKTFEKTMYTLEYEDFKRKCRYSKKLVILSEFKVF